MNRSYRVSCQLAPQIPHAFPATVSGSFSFGAYDAAKKYTKENLPGYVVIPGGVAYSDCRRFDAINHEAGIGASIWVKETMW
jgi:hypothetical protein